MFDGAQLSHPMTCHGFQTQSFYGFRPPRQFRSLAGNLATGKRRSKRLIPRNVSDHRQGSRPTVEPRTLLECPHELIVLLNRWFYTSRLRDFSKGTSGHPPRSIHRQDMFEPLLRSAKSINMTECDHEGTYVKGRIVSRLFAPTPDALIRRPNGEKRKIQLSERSPNLEKGSFRVWVS